MPTLLCPHCGDRFQFGQHQFGHTLGCPTCGSPIVIPALYDPTAAPRAIPRAIPVAAPVAIQSAPPRQKSALEQMFGCLAVLFLVPVALCSGCFGCTAFMGLVRDDTPGQTRPAAATASQSWSRGDRVRIVTSNKSGTFMAVDEAANDQLIKVCNAKDSTGLAELMLQGRAWSVDEGTSALVVDPGVFTTEVRLLDGPQAGRSGLLPSEFIAR
jgi:hypothetical protein